MGLDCREAGLRNVFTRWKKLAASTAVAAMIGAGVFLSLNGTAHSGGETRTLSLYHVHTKERLNITYMKDGKYIPSAMKKINYLMRDWRRNEVITISPRTIDLMWELHADLGSRSPIHIVCGYRSPKTNAFLKKVGRNVARKSQHMVGHAIDLYFPDVPTIKIRNSALVRQVGGVGYYSSGGGPTGFLHIDNGNVRHWGPAISQVQMAKIMRDYRKTVGARINKKGMQPVPEVEVAAADPTAARLPSQMEGDDEGDAENVKLSSKKKIPLETAYSNGDDEELASMSEDVSAAPAKPNAKPEDDSQDQADGTETVAEAEGVDQGYPVPKPRPKPIEVLMMAAVNMKIEPASAPPPDQTARTSPVAGNSQGYVIAPESLTESASLESNAAAKTSLTEDIENGDAQNVPTIRTITASASGDDLFWWPTQLVFDSNKAVRRDGAPQQFSSGSTAVATMLPGVSDAQAEEPPQTQRLAVAQMAPAPQEAASGKGDMLVVNREGKGSLLVSATPLKLGQADTAPAQ